MWRIYYYLSKFFFASAVLLILFTLFQFLTLSRNGTGPNLVERKDLPVWFYKVAIFDDVNTDWEGLLLAVGLVATIFVLWRIGEWLDLSW